MDGQLLNLLWLTTALPLAGFIVLAIVGPRMGRAMVSARSAGCTGVAAVIAIIIAVSFISSPPHDSAGTIAFSQQLYTWIAADRLIVPAGLLPRCPVGGVHARRHGRWLLILLYSTQFMAEDEGYSRFFAYMNLFVFSMLMLVLADNLLLLYLGWEGVGLCSYLLIGFWYTRPRQRPGGAQGLHRHARGRHGDGRRPVPAVRQLRHADIQPLMAGAASQWQGFARWRPRPRCCCWAGRWARARSCRCRPGCPMRWPAPRPSAPLSTPPRW